MTAIKEDIYRVRLFSKKGFNRRKCSICSLYFWTVGNERVDCGDQPCTPFNFIKSSPVRTRVESINELRSKYLRFFEKHGHVVVKPYPVVARWRDDVYFVGASIYDFQPWVTDGIVQPPGNPLVISQPCIRLTDLDIVGRSGRHLTSFEMMAHHAFNYPDKTIYWTNETVELAHEFFTKELGVDDYEITYKESVWEGGGNAGECFEVLIRGLEVATLVFMHYRVVDNKHIEMPMRIVDTGYGLERIYWLCTGEVNIYEAVFKEFLDKLRTLTNFEKPNPELMMKIMISLAGIDVESMSIEELCKLISNKLGLEYNEVLDVVKREETLYTLADHSRTTSWMISNGVLPSNSGIGYLVRLLIRKMLKGTHLLGVEVPLVEIFSKHLNILYNDYPEVKKFENLILEITNLEEKKFKELVNTTPHIITKLIRDKEKRTGKKSIDVEDLTLLYDSHGIPPEIVKQVCKLKLGLDIIIPENFYTLLASTRQRVDEEAKRREIEISCEEIQNILPTRELFYENSYITEFKAKVLKVIDNKYLILDKTAFYPEGGGQLPDKGYIKHEEEIAEVIDVQRIGNVIVHVVKGVIPKEDSEVSGIVDDEYRLGMMRMHTGTHILLHSIRKVLGDHVWQAGAQKDIPYSRLDITHHKLPTEDEIERIELIANNIIQKNLPVTCKFMNRTDAELKFGFQIYQGGVVPGKYIRIVKVGSDLETLDVQACGGTHLNSTGGVGLLKIIKADKIQEGVIRFIFTTGEHAIKYVRKIEHEIDNISKILNIQKEEVSKVVKELIDTRSGMETKIKKLMRKLALNDSKNLENTSEIIGKFKLSLIAYDDEDLEYIQEVAKEYTERNSDATLVVLNRRRNGTEYLVYLGDNASKKIIIKELIDRLNSKFSGKGGGSKTYGQGFTSMKLTLDNVKEQVINYLTEILFT